MNKSPYTAEQKAQAIQLYATDGPTVAEQRLGIPKGTVTKWAQAAGVDTTARNEQTAAATETIRLQREQMRERLRTEMLRRALDMLERMDHEHVDFKGKDADRVTYPKPSPQGCQAYATAAAILLDKFRLEAGEVTARSETRTTDQLDREIAQLLERAHVDAA